MARDGSREVATAVASFGMTGFGPGTLIATEYGELAVQALRPGMRVLVLGGGIVSVAWTGRRRVVPRLHPQPKSVRPIRVMRDAIAESIPPRDLLVGPGQPLFLSGVSIPARFLLNGGTVIADTAGSSIDYFHVALDGPGRPLTELIPVDPCDGAAARRAFGRDTAIELHPGLMPFEFGPSVLAAAVQELLKRRALQKGLVPASGESDLRPPAPLPVW